MSVEECTSIWVTRPSAELALTGALAGFCNASNRAINRKDTTVGWDPDANGLTAGLHNATTATIPAGTLPSRCSCSAGVWNCSSHAYCVRRLEQRVFIHLSQTSYLPASKLCSSSAQSRQHHTPLHNTINKAADARCPAQYTDAKAAHFLTRTAAIHFLSSIQN